jgi:hypothetical protein
MWLPVDGEIFVVQTGHRSAEPNSISVPAGFKRREQLIASNPRVFYLKPHYKPYRVVLVRLECIDRDELRELLRSAYRAVSSGAVKPGRRRTDKSRGASRKRSPDRKQVPKEFNGLHWPLFA